MRTLLTEDFVEIPEGGKYFTLDDSECNKCFVFSHR